MTIVSGWLALLLFILSFYAAARLPLFNRVASGLKKQLKWHHGVALLSLAAMFWHLGTILLAYIGQMNQLFDPWEFSLSTGWLALAGITLTVILAFLRPKLDYRPWRRLHLITPFCLLLALLHCYLLMEPTTTSEWLQYTGTASFALVALLLTVVLPNTRFWGRAYAIYQKSEPRPGLFLLQLKPQRPQKELRFEAGHFIFLRFNTPGFSSLWHPFTIVSGPPYGDIQLFVKARGRDTNLLKDASLPSDVSVLGPFGEVFWQDSASQLWIAYGVGAAIFLAAIRSFPAKDRIHFICCDISLEQIFFSNELDLYQARYPSFSWEAFIGSGQDFVTKFPSQNLKLHEFSNFRICGHPGFQKSVKSKIMAQGIAPQRIRLEGLL